MLTWREHRSASRMAAERIGAWPGEASPLALRAVQNSGTLVGSWSHDHAVSVWNDKRAQLSGQAGQLDASNFPAQCDLAFVASLAGHLASCARCWRVGIYEDSKAAVPAAWLTWACARRPELAAILAPVMVELSGRALSTRPPGLR